MNPGRFMMPNMGMRFSPMMGANYMTRGNVGLFGRIGNSLRSFNWRGLLSGANRTLDVVNQTIPLIRKTGPMVNNMKSMFRLARAFGSATSGGVIRNDISNSIDSVVTDNAFSDLAMGQKKEVQVSNRPNFFI